MQRDEMILRSSLGNNSIFGLNTGVRRQAPKHTRTHTFVVYCAVQYKQWVCTWSICQSNLQVLQRKLQRNPRPDIYTCNTQTGHIQRLVLGAHTHVHTHMHTHAHARAHTHAPAHAHADDAKRPNPSKAEATQALVDSGFSSGRKQSKKS